MPKILLYDVSPPFSLTLLYTLLTSNSCKCGAEFCYVCGVNWNHCPCDQWNEERLVVRAREVVNRDAPRQLPRFEFNRRVDQMRNALRENHECAHRGWLPKIEGGNGQVFRCEMSAKRHTKFVMRCPHYYVHICADSAQALAMSVHMGRIMAICHQFISYQLSTPVLRSTHLRNLHRQEEKFGKLSLSS